MPIKVASLRYTRIATPIELSGSLAAVQSVTVGAMSAGRIAGVNVRVGDVVHAGDVIAQIDTSGYAAAVAQARAGAAAAAAAEAATKSTIDATAASITSAGAQLQSARAREALAATTAARMASLFAQGAISQQQRDQTQTDLAGARAAVAAAQAGVDGARNNSAAARAQSRAAADSAVQARAGVAAANVPLRDTTLTAPFGGIIVSKFVEPGAVVASGSPIVALQNSHDLEVDVAAPDDAVAGLDPGMAIEVRVDAAGGTPIPSRVRAIVPSQNPALRSVTLKIAVSSRQGLQPGMFARVSINGHTHSGWVAPLAALVTRAGQSGVFVVRDGTASFMPLQTGTVGAATVELLNIDGRATEVAVSGLQRIDDRSRVTVIR
ncbi:MAG: efflux RND transporter periplasmic adaptor subunit [Candidatus Velthaea sp.]